MRQSSALGFLLFLALICCANGLKSGISQAGSVTLGSLFTGGAVLQRDGTAGAWHYLTTGHSGCSSVGHSITWTSRHRSRSASVLGRPSGCQGRHYDHWAVAGDTSTSTSSMACESHRMRVFIMHRCSSLLQVEAGAQSASAIVSFGEVVLCSGQSNMGVHLRRKASTH